MIPRFSNYANSWDCPEDEIEGRTSQVLRSAAAATKFSLPAMVDVSTLTDQGVVVMPVEEFAQVLLLVNTTSAHNECLL